VFFIYSLIWQLLFVKGFESIRQLTYLFLNLARQYSFLDKVINIADEPFPFNQLGLKPYSIWCVAIFWQHQVLLSQRMYDQKLHVLWGGEVNKLIESMSKPEEIFL
jgi:hypothetical protein